MALNLGPSSASKSGAISVSAMGVTRGVVSRIEHLVLNCPRWGVLLDYSGMQNTRQQSVGESPPRAHTGRHSPCLNGHAILGIPNNNGSPPPCRVASFTVTLAPPCGPSSLLL